MIQSRVPNGDGLMLHIAKRCGLAALVCECAQQDTRDSEDRRQPKLKSCFRVCAPQLRGNGRLKFERTRWEKKSTRRSPQFKHQVRAGMELCALAEMPAACRSWGIQMAVGLRPFRGMVRG
jgi:hypothetical protein